MATCQAQQYVRDYQIISPTNGRMYQRSAGGYLVGCPNDALLDVRLEFCDGMRVEKRVCAVCADQWQADVNARFAYLQPLWTITVLSDVMQPALQPAGA